MGGWEAALVLGVVAAAGCAYAWDLDVQGWANAYYTAAAQAGAHSWASFFFGSLEVGNAASTDKPPAALWLMAMSLRVFGLSSWSLLLPQLLESLLMVVVLHRTVRLVAGRSAALVAALVLATTPVFLVLARFNDPDSLLTLLVLCAAYCTVRATRSEHRGWLVGIGALLGLAFLTKWMVAFVPAPAIALTLLRSRPRSLAGHGRRLAVVAAAASVSGLWWVVAVLATPAASRPYADSSGGTVLNLIVGQNGFSRLGSAGASAGGSGRDPVRGGPGLLRLVEQPFSGQIGWLVPLAIVALLVPSVVARRPRLPLGYLLFGGWFVTTALVFSLMAGPMHPYYTVLLSPALAALVGMGAADLWHARRSSAALLLGWVGAVYAAWVASSYPMTPRWVPTVVLGCATGATCLYAVSLRARGPVGRGAAATAALAAAVCLLVGPATFALATVRQPVTGANPLAGPGQGHVVAPYPVGLVRFLRAHDDGQTWLAAVPTATPASRLQLQSGYPVLPLGGFTGHTQAPVLGQIQHWVDQDRLRYLVVGGPYVADPWGTPPALRGSATAAVVSWARHRGCPMPVADTQLLVIDLEEGPCR